MILSYFVYIGLLLLCGLFAYLADRYNSKKCVWLIILALTLIAGLRDYSVGIDTYNYVTKFEYIANGAFRYAYGLEETFKYFCYFFLKLCPSNSALLALLALITNGCIIWRLWDFRKVSSFSAMVACYYMGFFFISLNGIRQLCAIGIILYSTKYLVKHQNFRYLLGVLAASVFHQSALIGVVLLGFELLQWKELSRGKKLFFLGIIGGSPIMIIFALRALERYERYFVNMDVDIGIMVPVKIAFFLASAVFVFVLYGKSNHFANWRFTNSADRDQILLATICYGVGLGLIFMSYFFPMMNRVGWYFTIYEGIYMGMLLKTKNALHKYVFGWCVLIVVGYGFWTAMTGNDQGTMPYLFIWQ